MLADASEFIRAPGGSETPSGVTHGKEKAFREARSSTTGDICFGDDEAVQTLHRFMVGQSSVVPKILSWEERNALPLPSSTDDVT